MLINSNDLNLDDLYKKYNKVIFYDDNDPYASRLAKSIDKINLEYFILIHDIDILLDVNDIYIESLFKFIKHHNYDRIDLKYKDKSDPSLIFEIDPTKDVGDWKIENTKDLTNGYFLLRDQDPRKFLYNVNPSIWKKSTLLSIMNAFSNKSYRMIEGMDVQNFCTQFNIFHLYSKSILHCGYFVCLDIFKFLHISHSGRLLLLNDSCTTAYGQSYSDAYTDYINIVNNFNLKKYDKWVK